MYITFFKKKERTIQNFSMKDYFNNAIYQPFDEYTKLTIKTNKPPKSYNKERVLELINNIIKLSEPFTNKNIKEFYTSFYIPKKSGGLRTINAPNEELKHTLRSIKDIFTYYLKILEHPSAYAYVTNRSCKNALEYHQKNQSRWFLKLDIKDFFPNCNIDFTIKMLKMVYPLQDIPEETLKEALQICFLNEGLPQGTPTSPILTNLIMVPIDYAITEYANKHNLKYTRYADDLLISSKYNFDWKKVQKEIIKIFKEFEAPFKIKKEKTRYGSSSGRNWNLGLMYNKDLNITIGAAKKKIFKAMINNFLSDTVQDKLWSLEDAYKLNGIISHYRSIEPEYINNILKKYEEKYNCSVRNTLKTIINK